MFHRFFLGGFPSTKNHGTRRFLRENGCKSRFVGFRGVKCHVPMVISAPAYVAPPKYHLFQEIRYAAWAFSLVGGGILTWQIFGIVPSTLRPFEFGGVLM